MAGVATIASGFAQKAEQEFAAQQSEINEQIARTRADQIAADARQEFDRTLQTLELAFNDSNVDSASPTSRAIVEGAREDARDDRLTQRSNQLQRAEQQRLRAAAARQAGSNAFTTSLIRGGVQLGRTAANVSQGQ
jgi:hypothetical protein